MECNRRYVHRSRVQQQSECKSVYDTCGDPVHKRNMYQHMYKHNEPLGVSESVAKSLTSNQDMVEIPAWHTYAAAPYLLHSVSFKGTALHYVLVQICYSKQCHACCIWPLPTISSVVLRYLWLPSTSKCRTLVLCWYILQRARTVSCKYTWHATSQRVWLVKHTI